MKKNDDQEMVDMASEVISAVFGVENAKLVKPLFLKNRTLTITCLNSSIVPEVKLHQQEIVIGLNKKLGNNEVDRVRYLT